MDGNREPVVSDTTEEIVEEVLKYRSESLYRTLMKEARSARGWVPWTIPTGVFIRDFMMKKGETYPFEVYRELKRARLLVSARLGRTEPPKLPSPISFYRYWWAIEKLGLVERTGRVEESPRRGTDTTLPSKLWRVYYRIRPGMESDPRWSNPQGAIMKERGWRTS